MNAKIKEEHRVEEGKRERVTRTHKSIGIPQQKLEKILDSLNIEN